MSDEDLDGVAAPDHAAAHLRAVLGHFCTGVTVITGLDAGDPLGFTVQAFQSLSLDPPLVLFSPQKTSHTWRRLRTSGAFCVNILASDQEPLCRAFAASGTDKYRGVGWKPAPRTGAPILNGVLGWVEATVEAEYDGGDHFLIVGRIQDLALENDGTPLLFYRGGFGRFVP